jgi:hypothetical protein
MYNIHHLKKPDATNMQRRPRPPQNRFLPLLWVSVETIERELAKNSKLREHEDALLHLLQAIKNFRQIRDDNAFLTIAIQLSLHDRLILPFAYEGVLFVLDVVYCGRCSMKYGKLNICSHGLSVSLLPATEHKQFVPTDFVESFLDFAIPSVAGPGHGIIYYEKLETAFPDFPGASRNLTSVLPIMEKYRWTAEELHLEKNAINEKALELATIHCTNVNVKIEEYRMEIKGIDCGSARLAPVERVGHTADHGKTSVGVGTVLDETRLAV